MLERSVCVVPARCFICKSKRSQVDYAVPSSPVPNGRRMVRLAGYASLGRGSAIGRESSPCA